MSISSDLDLRSIFPTAVQRPAPWLALGCGELGGTVTRSQSRRALECAFSAGIFYYDVARSYGCGQAESLVGDFARGKRDQLIIATKAGIPAPHFSRWKLAVRQRLARPARFLRSWLGSRRTLTTPTARAAAGESVSRDQTRFQVQQIRSSVETSLRQLQTDWVDVLHLHSVMPGDVTEELLVLLDELVASGKVRQLGLATNPRACREILVRTSSFRVVQFRDSIGEPNLDLFSKSTESALPGTVAPRQAIHSVFGRDGQMRAVLRACFGSHPELRQKYMERWGVDPGTPGGLISILLQLAFWRNPGGIVICGMLSASHLEQNVAVRSRWSRDTDYSELWKELQAVVSAAENSVVPSFFSGPPQHA